MVYGETDDRIACMAEVISHTRYEVYENVENLLFVLEVIICLLLIYRL